MTITLNRTKDILAIFASSLPQARLPVLVGFAAENNDVVAYAKGELRKRPPT